VRARVSGEQNDTGRSDIEPVNEKKRPEGCAFGSDEPADHFLLGAPVPRGRRHGNAWFLGNRDDIIMLEKKHLDAVGPGGFSRPARAALL
jgi:hypothetical protein